MDTTTVMMMISCWEHNYRLAAATKTKTRVAYSRAQKKCVLKNTKTTDNISHKKSIMEAVRDNVKSKTILDMDLSRYKRRPVPKAFHLTAKPSRDTLEQQKLTRLNRKLYGLYCYDSLGMLTSCKTNKVQSAPNGAIGSFIKTLDLLQLFHHIILLMHVTLYLIYAACLI